MGRYLDIIEAESQRQDSGGSSESTNRQYDKSDQNDKSRLMRVPEHEAVCNLTTKAPRCGFQGSATTPTPGGAAAVSTPQGPISWHDTTPDGHAEIKAALFEGLPVQILSQVLGEIVWWVKDDAVAQRLRGGEFVKQGYPPYQGETIYAWSELLAVIGFPPDALKNLHAFKKAFDARISKPRVICSGCRHLAVSHHHCVMRKDIRIANANNPIECDLYMTR